MKQRVPSVSTFQARPSGQRANINRGISDIRKASACTRSRLPPSGGMTGLMDCEGGSYTAPRGLMSVTMHVRGEMGTGIGIDFSFCECVAVGAVALVSEHVPHRRVWFGTRDHRNLKIIASSEFGGNGALQFSQVGRSSSTR